MIQMLQAFQDIFAKCRIVSVLLIDAAPTAFKKRRPLSLPFTRQVMKLPLKLLLKDGRLRNSKVERVGKAFRDHLKGISTLLSAVPAGTTIAAQQSFFAKLRLV